MAIDPELIEYIKKNTDIVKIISSYQPVTQKGKDYVALCPFHDDSNPSMHINPQKQIFKCFVCGTGGDAIQYVRKREHLSYIEALRKVAELSGISDPRLDKAANVHPVNEKLVPLYKCLKDLTTFYQYALTTPEGKEGLDYLESRLLNEEMRNKYNLGYAPKDGKATIAFLQSKGHSLQTIEQVGIATISGGTYSDKNAGRVIFSLKDASGNVIGYSARTLKAKDDAKYVNTQETPLFHKSNILYNYDRARETARMDGYVYVLEGFMDVFALSRIGIESAVAIMGTALTVEHIEMLRRLNVEVRLCLDGDLPGQMNTVKASKLLQKSGLKFRIVDNQNNPRDPDEIFKEDGPNALRTYLSTLISRPDFVLNYLKNSNPLKSPEEKKTLIKEYIPILLSIDNVLEVDSYIRKISAITGYEIESINNLVNEARKSGAHERINIISRYQPEKKILHRLQLAEREMLYLMTSHKEAVEFYENKVAGFYEDSYREIANYIIEYASNHEEIDVSGIIDTINGSEASNSEQLINELTAMQYEKNHINITVDEEGNPNLNIEEILNSLLDSINKEKEKINEDDILKASLEGKDPLEQARILNEHNRRKAKNNQD